MANDSAYVTQYRQTVTNFLQVLNTLDALRRQWDSLDYSNSLTPEDFAPPNDDIDLAALTAAVASVEAISGFVQSGHGTNLYTIVI